MTTTSMIKKELEALIKQGNELYLRKLAIEAAKEYVKEGRKEKEILKAANEVDHIAANFQKWYSKALPVIHQLLPDRYFEFQECYKLDRRKEINAVTYTISDYLVGLSVKFAGEEAFSSVGVFLAKFRCQIDILESANLRIDSILTNIRGVLQAELFDNELSVANELLKKKHLRPAGALAGVLVERHLGQVVNAHSVAIHKKTTSISDLNDALKNEGILDVPNWRFIQRLGDIRNLCVHSKDREPTSEEVEDLIRGAEKVLKTVF